MCLIFQSLANMDDFRNLDRDIEGSAKRWKKFVESECPEKEKFPQEWKNKSSLQKLCMMRALRPDRMTYALRYELSRFIRKPAFGFMTRSDTKLAVHHRRWLEALDLGSRGIVISL